MSNLARTAAASLALLGLLVACSKPADPPPPISAPTVAVPAQPNSVAWIKAHGDAEVDAAFARARAEAKPVFLYWGAT